jgi:KDO2-lipid IV(A) lauroyltransferase
MIGSTVKSDPGSVIIILLLKCLAYLPLKLIRIIGKGLGRLWAIGKSDYYLTARKNFDLCFPNESYKQHHQRAVAMLLETGQTLLEAAHAWVRPLAKNQQSLSHIYGEQHLEEAIAAKEGIIFIVPHLGNWEWLNVYLPKFCPIDVLYKSIELPGLDEFVAAQRKRCNINVWPGNGMGLRSYIRTFLNGGNILILPDQEPAESSGVFAPFFGVQALTPRIVGDLLRKRPKAKVLVVYALRTHKGFDIHIEQPNADIYDTDPVLSATALNKSIELAVRKAPNQYQWGYKRFKTQPENAISPYKKLKWRFKEKEALRKTEALNPL